MHRLSAMTTVSSCRDQAAEMLCDMELILFHTPPIAFESTPAARCWIVRDRHTDILGVKREKSVHVEAVRDTEELEYPMCIAGRVGSAPERNGFPAALLYGFPDRRKRGGYGAHVGSFHGGEVISFSLAAFGNALLAQLEGKRECQVTVRILADDVFDPAG